MANDNTSSMVVHMLRRLLPSTPMCNHQEATGEAGDNHSQYIGSPLAHLRRTYITTTGCSSRCIESVIHPPVMRIYNQK